MVLLQAAKLLPPAPTQTPVVTRQACVAVLARSLTDKSTPRAAAIHTAQMMETALFLATAGRPALYRRNGLEMLHRVRRASWAACQALTRHCVMGHVSRHMEWTVSGELSHVEREQAFAAAQAEALEAIRQRTKHIDRVVPCVKCGGTEAVFQTEPPKQIRCGDEGMTFYFGCRACDTKWFVDG